MFFRKGENKVPGYLFCNNGRPQEVVEARPHPKRGCRYIIRRGQNNSPWGLKGETREPMKAELLKTGWFLHFHSTGVNCGGDHK